MTKSIVDEFCVVPEDAIPTNCSGNVLNAVFSIQHQREKRQNSPKQDVSFRQRAKEDASGSPTTMEINSNRPLRRGASAKITLSDEDMAQGGFNNADKELMRRAVRPKQLAPGQDR